MHSSVGEFTLNHSIWPFCVCPRVSYTLPNLCTLALFLAWEDLTMTYKILPAVKLGVFASVTGRDWGTYSYGFPWPLRRLTGKLFFLPPPVLFWGMITSYGFFEDISVISSNFLSPSHGQLPCIWYTSLYMVHFLVFAFSPSLPHSYLPSLLVSGIVQSPINSVSI